MLNKLHRFPEVSFKYMAFPVRNSGLCSLGFVEGSVARGRDAHSGPLRTAG